ncbi:MAG: hypothetical protein COB35_13755 [Gammaproteobacteria bacterium]|nr:MAG: hypothetical protein COB35_13755 [Gammaproteobacteria bacterium]
MPLSRSRSSANKIYLPSSTRENQYLLIDIPLTEQLINHIQAADKTLNNDNLSAFYYYLSELFFNACDQFELKNAVFMANDKLPKVHFNSELYQVESSQRVVFFYDPALHTMRQSYFHGEYKAKKIKLLFLASGEDVRLNSPRFNAQVGQVMKVFAEKTALNINEIRVRDHQHLTYDLFAKEKGCHRSQGHKLRAMPVRYSSQNLNLPKTITEISYVVATLPLTNDLKNLVDINFSVVEPFKPLYEFINDTLKTTATSFGINSGAVIANGLIPIVRQSTSDEDQEALTRVGEIQKLTYNSENPQQDFVLSCDGNALVNEVYIVMVASKENFDHQGYAKFLQKVEHTLTALSQELKIDSKKDEVMLRMHQHISLNL